jgi:hypothetical protein
VIRGGEGGEVNLAASDPNVRILSNRRSKAAFSSRAGFDRRTNRELELVLAQPAAQRLRISRRQMNPDA